MTGGVRALGPVLRRASPVISSLVWPTRRATAVTGKFDLLVADRIDTGLAREI
jgi:hypothetical protein